MKHLVLNSRITSSPTEGLRTEMAPPNVVAWLSIKEMLVPLNMCSCSHHGVVGMSFEMWREREILSRELCGKITFLVFHH